MTYKILVADDKSDNRIIAKEALEAAGYEVTECADGMEVLERIKTDKPDLLFLDLSMPKTDGWQVVRKIKEDSSHAHIPVIAFTAHAMEGDDKKAKDAGCDDYLSKPCLPKSIIEKADHWLKRSAHENTGD